MAYTVAGGTKKKVCYYYDGKEMHVHLEFSEYVSKAKLARLARVRDDSQCNVISIHSLNS